ncbi:MmpS family transport accessory protein [Streptomyces finlayi]|uniref:MmpS family transport accessory protein n=1 Tax=Streptomyces finlayi TaxID=67296 RepID=UPI00162AC9BC|nr:MmpS family transport accessory protein [Streptomyces finlayi]
MVVLLLTGGCVAVVALVVNGVSEESDRTVRVRYEVTGTAKGVTIAYTTWRDGDLSTSQETGQSLPWRRDVEATGFVKGGTLAVTVGAAGGNVRCSVTVDDGSRRTATASGPSATATCTGF